MIYGENQNRQIYVVDATNTATCKKALGKFYAKMSADNVSTDKISKGMVRDVRISKPAGPALKEWSIAIAGGTLHADEDYILYFDFKNCLGFGENDRYQKFAIVHCTSAMVSDPTLFYDAMGKQIVKQFAREAYKPFDVLINPKAKTVANEFTAVSNTYTTLVISVSAASEGVTESTGTVTVSLTSGAKTLADLKRVVRASGKDLSIYAAGTATDATTISALSSSNTMAAADGLYLREKDSTVTKEGIIRGLTRLLLDVDITSGPVYDGSGNLIEHWATQSDTTVDSTGITIATKIASAPWKQYSNAEVIADMEYFFMKGRADMYGYMGFPNINPTAMRVDPQGASDYYVLDIKYYFQEHGMLNQNSEKEMTFVCTNISSLKSIADNLVSGYTNVAGTSKTPGSDAIDRVFIGTVNF